MRLEVTSQELIDGSFQHESIVDSNIPDVANGRDTTLSDSVPTGLTATGNRLVHDVVRDKEECL